MSKRKRPRKKQEAAAPAQPAVEAIGEATSSPEPVVEATPSSAAAPSVVADPAPVDMTHYLPTSVRAEDLTKGWT